MAAERRSTFAHSGPLSPTQTGAPRYNRFNFRDYMKQHVRKLTDAETRKTIQMVAGTSTDRTEKEPDTATTAQEDKAPRSRSTTPGGTRKQKSVHMTREQQKEWHAKHPQQKPEEGAAGSQEATGPKTFDLATPEPESKVKEQVARLEGNDASKRTLEEAGMEDARRVSPEEPPMTMSTPTGSKSGLWDPDGKIDQFEGASTGDIGTPSFAANSPKPRRSASTTSRTSSRGPPPKAHQPGTRSPSPTKTATSPAAALAEETPRPAGPPSIVVPVSPEKTAPEITPDMQVIIDYFEKKDAERNDMITELRKKVKMLSGIIGEKGELDPWALSELTGDPATVTGPKRPRDEVEAPADKPPGLMATTRTATKSRSKIEKKKLGIVTRFWVPVSTSSNSSCTRAVSPLAACCKLICP